MMKALHKLIWKINYKIYPCLRDLILFLGLWKHSGRQKFRIGFLKKNIEESDVKKILEKKGFERSICSWIDDCEVLSMRKRVGSYQYHIRLFSDGEIRGHYEYSPENKPFGHLNETVFRSEKCYFCEVLGDVLD